METGNALNKAMLQINQRPIAVYPAYIGVTACLEGGVLLSQLCFWSSAMKGQAFYKTDAEIRLECHLTEREFRRAKQSLRSLPFIKVTLRGVPARTWYEIDHVALLEYIGYHLESVQTSSDDAVQTRSDDGVRTSIDDAVQTSPITENNTETTSKRERDTSTRLPEEDKTVWPDWYATLYAIPGFKRPFKEAETWRTTKGITEEHAEITAYALKGKWTAKKYPDVWATFQHWCKMPPLNNRSGGHDVNGAKGTPEGIASLAAFGSLGEA